MDNVLYGSWDRAAYKCGREPNFELSEEEKQELQGMQWDEFLALTRSAIANKSNLNLFIFAILLSWKSNLKVILPITICS